MSLPLILAVVVFLTVVVIMFAFGAAELGLYVGE